MKKIVSMLLLLVLLTGCVASFASCGEPKDAGPEISVYLGEEIYDFDPTAYYADSNEDQVMSLLFEPLFTLNERGKLKYAMADDYDVFEEDRKIVITLRESYWSDEIRVTAADFIFAWRDILLEPGNANPAASLLYDIENAVALKTGDASLYEFGAVASDTYEITITYREGANYEQLLKNLASVSTSPLRQDLVTQSNESFWTKVGTYAVTNGAFKLGTFDYALGEFTLMRNIGYHQNPADKDYTKTVTPFKLVSFVNPNGNEIDVSYAELEAKTRFYLSDATLAERRANKDNALVNDDLSTYTYIFNTENPLFAIKEVRQALNMAIDRNAIIDAITFGKAATGFIPSSVLGSDNKSFRTTDLISATAKATEAEALLATVDLTGVSKSFTLTVNNDEESLAIAGIAKAAWDALGFDVTIKAAGVTTNTVVDVGAGAEISIKDSEIQSLINEAARGNRNFDVIAVDWQMYSTDAFVALAAFSCDFSGNGVDLPAGVNKFVSIGGFSDAEYNALIAAAFSATTKEARDTALHAAEKILVESAYVCPLVFNQNFAFVSRDISGIEVDGFGNFVLKEISQKNYRDYLNQ